MREGKEPKGRLKSKGETLKADSQFYRVWQAMRRARIETNRPNLLIWEKDMRRVVFCRGNLMEPQALLFLVG